MALMVALMVAQVVVMVAAKVLVKEVPAEGGKGNGVQVWEAATLASRENLGAGDEERAVDEGIPGRRVKQLWIGVFQLGAVAGAPI